MKKFYTVAMEATAGLCRYDGGMSSNDPVETPPTDVTPAPAAAPETPDSQALAPGAPASAEVGAGEIIDALPLDEVVLRTHGLSRAFGKVQAVRGVSLELSRGQVYGFLGRNGAGKTTTLRMLIGVLRPDAGEVEILGERGPRVRPAQRRSLGYVSQEQVFYPWMTAADLGRFMAGFYPTWDEQEYARLLRVLDVPPDRRSRQLSGGTRAKLGLALALAHRPPVLIMDEPTAGLDPVARREFLDILGDQVRRSAQAVLLSSHLVSEVEQICNRIGILQDGVLRYQGSLEDLRASHRRIVETADAPALLPEPAEIIRTEAVDGRVIRTVRADARAWDACPTAGERLSLEDVFLAYAKRAEQG